MLRVAVVIPSYNCAHLLERSVASAFSLRGCKTQVIVVDDGSTDATVEILADLKQRYSSLTALRKPNGGLSSARNCGIDYICENELADFLILLDADDALFPADLSALLTGAPDMVRIGVEETVLGEVGSTLHVERPTKVSGRSYLQSRFQSGAFYTPSWAYIYRMDWLCEIKLRFVDGLLHEDNLFTVEALLQAHGVVAVPDLVYHYIRRPGSITLSPGDDRLLNRIAAYTQIADRLTAIANLDPSFDLRWKIHEVLDGALLLSMQCQSRLGKRLALYGLIKFMLQYRGTGRHGFRYAQRARLMRYLKAWWRHRPAASPLVNR